jgi:hypothetical protein
MFGVKYQRLYRWSRRGARVDSLQLFEADVAKLSGALKTANAAIRLAKSNAKRKALEWGYKPHYLRNWRRLGARLDSKDVFDADVSRLRNERRALGIAKATAANSAICKAKRIARYGSDAAYQKHRNNRQRQLIKQNPLRRSKRNAQCRKWYASNAGNLRLTKALRRRVNKAVAANAAMKAGKTFELIGCDAEYLRRHLESQFQRGMTWGNYGAAWHVDHIIPCSHFDLTRSDHQRTCFNWQNLRPLWAADNVRRQDKLEQPTQIAIPLAI